MCPRSILFQQYGKDPLQIFQNWLNLSQLEWTLEVKRLRSICTEIYKTTNDLNAPYMKELFIPRNSTYALRGSQNLSVPSVNQTTYGLKSIRYQGPKIWNSLPADFQKSKLS